MNVVCPHCQGEGTKDTKSDGWTGSDVAEWQHDNPDEDWSTEYQRGRFSESCPLCHGRNVVTEEQEQEWWDEAEMRAEQEAERRAGC